MNAHTIYKLMKPHLEHLNSSEKYSLTKLINSKRPDKVTCNHRKIISVSKAKEQLKNFCRQEMEREQKSPTSL